LQRDCGTLDPIRNWLGLRQGKRLDVSDVAQSFLHSILAPSWQIDVQSCLRSISVAVSVALPVFPPFQPAFHPLPFGFLITLWLSTVRYSIALAQESRPTNIGNYIYCNILKYLRYEYGEYNIKIEIFGNFQYFV